MNLLRSKEAAKMLGVTVTTLRDMDKRGVLHTVRTQGNQRRFYEDEVKKLMGIREIRNPVIYARVSSYDQKGDLNRQILRLHLKYPDAEEFKDIRSGLKFDRSGLNHLLDAIRCRRVSVVCITHKDRLARFGFDLLENVFAGYGTKIEVIEDDDGGNEKNKSAQEEMIKDLISIITSFSDRLYGMRSHKKKRLVDIVKKEVYP